MTLAAAPPRRLPQRTCVACRRTRQQHVLIRLVRSPAGAVAVDRQGRAPGRGAYLCPDRGCWHDALAGPQLARALRTVLSDSDRARLRAFAAEPSNHPGGTAHDH